MTENPTAFQKIIGDEETARNLLSDLETGIEDFADSNTGLIPFTVELELDVHSTDLPQVFEELREMIDEEER